MPDFWDNLKSNLRKEASTVKKAGEGCENCGHISRGRNVYKNYSPDELDALGDREDYGADDGRMPSWRDAPAGDESY